MSLIFRNLNTFRFYPSVAKKIAEEIVNAELNEMEYDEEDAKGWALTIGDKVRDALRSNILSCVFHSF
jgi:hypothetical protein